MGIIQQLGSCGSLAVVKNVVNTCIHRRPRKNTKKVKLLFLYLLGLLCSSVKGGWKFLQNLYSSVRFRSPPPTKSITYSQTASCNICFYVRIVCEQLRLASFSRALEDVSFLRRHDHCLLQRIVQDSVSMPVWSATVALLSPVHIPTQHCGKSCG